MLTQLINGNGTGITNGVGIVDTVGFIIYNQNTPEHCTSELGWLKGK